MPMFTQYVHNPYVLNPAAGGTTINTEAMIGYRNQWSGFEGAPKTFYFSMHGALGSVNQRTKRTHSNDSRQARSLGSYHGVGGYIFTDNTGPISHSGLYASYAYHLEIDAGNRQRNPIYARRHLRYIFTRRAVFCGHNSPVP